MLELCLRWYDYLVCEAFNECSVMNNKYSSPVLSSISDYHLHHILCNYHLLAGRSRTEEGEKKTIQQIVCTEIKTTRAGTVITKMSKCTLNVMGDAVACTAGIQQSMRIDSQLNKSIELDLYSSFDFFSPTLITYPIQNKIYNYCIF
jgi:hypothetical protein